MLNHPKRQRVFTPLTDKLTTKQSHADECDIYNILKQYQRTGIVTHIAAQAPRYEDLPEVGDYQESLNHIMRAEAAFDALPASVRDSFDNSSAAFLAAFADDKQHDKLRDLGLLQPKPAAVQAAPAPAAPKEA